MTKDWPVKWQVLETKARFINQVMNGSVTVRQAEDLEGGALTYAENKAIASGNPAVMEKVKVDTEIRKLDQLRASHINQQHNIRWQVKSLPEQIERARKHLTGVLADIATRISRNRNIDLSKNFCDLLRRLPGPLQPRNGFAGCIVLQDNLDGIDYFGRFFSTRLRPPPALRARSTSTSCANNCCLPRATV